MVVRIFYQNYNQKQSELIFLDKPRISRGGEALKFEPQNFFELGIDEGKLDKNGYQDRRISKYSKIGELNARKNNTNMILFFVGK